MKRDGHPPMKKKTKYLKPSKRNRSTLYTGLGGHSPASENDQSETDTAAGEAESDEEDAEEDDLPRDNAPPKAGQSFPKYGKKATGAGLNDSHETQAPDADSEVAEEEIEGTEFDIAEDDDDYEGVDGVSEVSDDSAAFEAEVENEIFAAGEDGIDWDDKNTYGYCGSSLMDSQFFLDEVVASDALFGGSEWDFEDFTSNGIANSEQPPVQHSVFEFHSKSWSPKLEIDWEGSSSSSSNDDAVSNGTAKSPADSPSRRTSHDTSFSAALSPFNLRCMLITLSFPFRC